MSLFHNCWKASAGWPRQFSRRLRAPANSPQEEEAASAPCDGRELRTSRKGTCQSEGDSDGGRVRHTERALRPEASQGPDEVDRNPVHLLRHPHGKRCAAGGQDRAESTAGGILKRKHAHRKVLSQGNCTPVIEN